MVIWILSFRDILGIIIRWRVKMEDGFDDFDWNHHLGTSGIMVVSNMNDMDDGGMLGVDMECYAYYGVHLMVECNTVDGGKLRVPN